MKKMRMLLTFVASLVIMSSCNNGGASSSDPKEVLMEFFKRMSKKDVDGAAKLATKESKSTMDIVKKGMEDDKMKKEGENPSDDFDKAEFGEAKIDGETATVAVKKKGESKQMDFTLKKEDGAWKVDFSMGALMRMGMSAKDDDMGMDEEGNNINVEDAQRVADSLMKNMEMKDTTSN